MKRYDDWQGLAPDARGAAAAVGNFDGVHLGHRAVIDRAGAMAGRLDAPLGVVTFEPHPREVFVPDTPPFRLTGPEARAHRLETLGVATLIELPFDARLAALSPERFVAEVLSGGLGLSGAVVGADFRFGKGRAGDAEGLRRLGNEAGMDVEVLELVAGEAGRVSSSAIRTALSEGRPRDAAGMLGHWHRIEGPVLHGDARGRTLGYPTANMALDGLHPPRFGVYAVLVDVLTGPLAGTRRGGVASLGIRPMFRQPAPTIETVLLDFEGDLYGAHLSVALVAFLREEARFDGIDALIRQMESDTAAARAALTDV